MKTAIRISHDEIMGCVGACKLRVEEVEKSIAAIPNMV